MQNARLLLPPEVVFCDSALEGAHAVVLATEWQDFSELPWEQVAEVMIPPRVIFDGRNVLDGRRLVKLGFRYRGVGRSGPKWNIS